MFSLEPLRPYIDRTRIELVDQFGPDVRDAAAFALVIGRSVTTAHRWLRAGVLTEQQADDVAIRLGLHPALLWEGWYDQQRP
jgi:hypothetical protein